jgi:predicted ribosome quality control (RQC) complex YloA/Tae2 family protein
VKPLSLPEFTQIALSLQSMVGAQLQDCVQTESEVGLAFYHERETVWLWFDLNPLKPLLVRVHGKPPARKKITRPLSLFIKARFVGRRLESVRADLVRGRILVMTFHRSREEDVQESPELEVRLFPHGQNVIAHDGKSIVAERKPKDLPPSVPPTSDVLEAARTWEQIEEEWRSEQASRSKGVPAAARDAEAVEREWKKAVEKKQKALERMNEELAAKTSSQYRELGEWLKTHGTLEVPEEWRGLIKTGESLSWNIEEVFRRAKENVRKAEGTRERIAALEAEVVALKAQGPGAFSKRLEREQKASGENLLARADARGRRLKVGEDLEVYIGKSAGDNLALLRRAQPFDLWLHLRDQPGSHAILRRARGRLVSDAELMEAGRWVVEHSLGRRANELKGERHDLLVVECRFVKPIKGDRLGRVNYTNDRVIRIAF